MSILPVFLNFFHLFVVIIVQGVHTESRAEESIIAIERSSAVDAALRRREINCGGFCVYRERRHEKEHYIGGMPSQRAHREGQT